MKSLAAFVGFILLGTATSAHKLAESEAPLFLNDGVQTVHRVGNILEDKCVYEKDNSIYNLNTLKDTTKNYQVGLKGIDDNFKNYMIVFNMCEDLVNPS